MVIKLSRSIYTLGGEISRTSHDFTKRRPKASLGELKEPIPARTTIDRVHNIRVLNARKNSKKRQTSIRAMWRTPMFCGDLRDDLTVDPVCPSHAIRELPCSMPAVVFLLV